MLFLVALLTDGDEVRTLGAVFVVVIAAVSQLGKLPQFLDVVHKLCGCVPATPFTEITFIVLFPHYFGCDMIAPVAVFIE